MVAVLFSIQLFATESDYTLNMLSCDDIFGTSRYMGMAGAMVAVGGDISAVKDNPASLGLFRRSEISCSLAADFSTTSFDNQQHTRSRYMVPELSWLFNFKARSGQRGGLYNSIALSYHRVTSFQNGWKVKFVPSYARNEQSLSLKEYGAIDDYSIDWGMNISNHLYVGAGMTLRSLYAETNAVISDTIPYYWGYKELGFRFQSGIIWRPVTWLRLGAAFYSPIFATNIGRLPLRSTSGVAFQFHEQGMLSLEYDYLHDDTKRVPDSHMIKAGGEYVCIKQLFINAGYALRISDLRHYVSAGFSWRSNRFTAGLAYQFSISKEPMMVAYYNVSVMSRSAGNRLVVSIAWRY